MDAMHSSQLYMTDANESSVERDIKQRAATSLFDPSVLLFHSLSMNEVRPKPHNETLATTENKAPVSRENENRISSTRSTFSL